MNHASRFLPLGLVLATLIPLSAEPPPFDAAGLDAAVAREMPGTRALIVARGRDILYERYAADGGPDSPMPVLAASNVIVASLYGAGLRAGLLPPPDTKIEAALGRVRGSDVRFHEERIGNFLTMTAGLAGFNFPYWEGDPLQMIYRRKMLLGPGEVWNPEYEDAQVIIHLVGRLSGLTVPEATSKLLFEPLGISNFVWNRDPLGAYDLLTPVSLLPRDFLKFGQLHLAQGMWGETRILEAAWTEAASSSQVEVPFAKRRLESVVGMGYYWWIIERPGFKGYAAFSEGGQMEDSPQSILLVLPELGAVLLFWSIDPPASGATMDTWIDFLERNVVERLKTAAS